MAIPIGVGNVSTPEVARLIAQTYDPIFSSLRDTGTTIKKLLFHEEPEGNDVIRWHIDANDVNKVRSVSEDDLLKFIDSTVLSTTTGSGTPGAGVFLTPNLHPVVDASMDIRHLVQTIMIGAKQLAAIKGGKDSFQNILTRETKLSLEDWKRGIDDMLIRFNDDFRTLAAVAGNSGKDLDSLDTLLSVGGTSYAGVNYATSFPEYAPYVNHNTGVARALSIALLQDVMNKLEASPAGAVQRHAHVDQIICGAQQFTNYGNLLTAQRRYTASETLDGGFQSLEFNNRKLVSVPRFTANKILFAQKSTPEGDQSYEYRVLKNMDTSDKSDNIVAGLLIVMIHMANTVAKGRMQQGVLTDLS